MSLLDRFKKGSSSPRNKGKEFEEVRLYSPEYDQEFSRTILVNRTTLSKQAPETNFTIKNVKTLLHSIFNPPQIHAKIDSVQKKFIKAKPLYLGPIHAELGVLQHVLAVALSPEDFKSYIQSNKDAIDILLYCNFRFSNLIIPPELHYADIKINEVLEEYKMKSVNKNPVGIYNRIQTHLKKYKLEGPMYELFQPQNHDLLLSKLAAVTKTFNVNDEYFMSIKKADFLLQTLGLFIQNHYSTESYLFYDKRDKEDWSDSTKFALNYLSSDIPLEKLRINQLCKLIEKIGHSNIGVNINLFVTQIEEETLGYGLDILIIKTKKLTTPVRDILRDRFTERHMMYWRGLKKRISYLINQSSISL